MRTFSTQHRLLITGTPLQNSLHELWALLNFLVPSMFDAAADFTSMFDLTSSTAEEGDKKSIVTRLHRILRPFLLRRLKSDVESTLLPKIETNLHIGMSALQRQWYAKVLSREVEVLNANTAQNKSKAGKLRLLNIVMQLRKCCNHPYLVSANHDYRIRTLFACSCISCQPLITCTCLVPLRYGDASFKVPSQDPRTWRVSISSRTAVRWCCWIDC